MVPTSLIRRWQLGRFLCGRNTSGNGSGSFCIARGVLWMATGRDDAFERGSVKMLRAAKIKFQELSSPANEETVAADQLRRRRVGDL